jgi:hypothetical protein
VDSTIEVTVPEDYASGQAPSGNITWDNVTIVSLGLRPGTYTWHWGIGVDTDSFTVEVANGSTVVDGGAIPEHAACPSCWLASAS